MNDNKLDQIYIKLHNNIFHLIYETNVLTKLYMASCA